MENLLGEEDSEDLKAEGDGVVDTFKREPDEGERQILGSPGSY